MLTSRFGTECDATPSGISMSAFFNPSTHYRRMNQNNFLRQGIGRSRDRIARRPTIALDEHPALRVEDQEPDPQTLGGCTMPAIFRLPAYRSGKRRSGRRWFARGAGRRDLPQAQRDRRCC